MNIHRLSKLIAQFAMSRAELLDGISRPEIMYTNDLRDRGDGSQRLPPVLDYEELSEKGRKRRDKFEILFLACLARESICRAKLKAFSPIDLVQTELRPNAHNTLMLARLLREDDLAETPYLGWSRDDLEAALIQRHVIVPNLQSLSRLDTRLALENADANRRFRFMDLPKEIRTMIYERALLHHADIVVKDCSAPALLAVSKQIRKEATKVFFRINRFQLRVAKKALTTLEPFQMADSLWLHKIGSKNVARIRHFSFFVICYQPFALEFDLTRLEVARCVRAMNKDFVCHCGSCSCQTRTTLGEELASCEQDGEDEDDNVPSWVKMLVSTTSSPSDAPSPSRTERLELEMCALQEEMDRFSLLCKSGKEVCPTLRGLQQLAFAVLQGVLF